MVGIVHSPLSELGYGPPRPQALRSNIHELEDSIRVEESKADQLRRRIAASTGDTLDRQEELLRQLNKEVSAFASWPAKRDARHQPRAWRERARCSLRRPYAAGRDQVFTSRLATPRHPQISLDAGRGFLEHRFSRCCFGM